MKYSSVAEYFYKLNNRGYLYLLPPLILTVVVILWFGDTSSPLWVPRYPNLALHGTFAMSLLWLLTVWLWQRRLIRSMRGEVSLGSRLDRYAPVVFRRLLAGALVGLVAAVGFYLTADLGYIRVTILFLLWTAITWPTRERLCKELQLTSSEQEVILK